MGVWERVGTLLSGGAKVEVDLESERVPAGAFVSGTARIVAGRRGEDLVGVHVSLVRTAVRPPGSSTTSEIRQSAIVDTTVGSRLRLEPRATRELPFSFRVPPDAEPSDDDTSYRVRVEAEASSGRSPKAYKPLRVLDAMAGRPGESAIARRYPGLTSEDGPEQIDALRELRWAHDPEDPDRDYIAYEGKLSALVLGGEGTVRTAALEAWSSVISGRVTDDHVQLLETLTGRKDVPPPVLITVAEAAGRLTGGRGLPVLKRLADHADAAVRRAVATAAGAAEKPAAKRELLESMKRDASPAVRAAVLRSFIEFADDEKLIESTAAHTTMEPSAPVLVACVPLLAKGFSHGFAEIVRPTLDRLARHPKAEVRVALAKALVFVEQDEGSLPIARALLADPDDEVRYAAAAEIRNLPIRGRSLVGLLEAMAIEDPSPKARRGALTSLPEFTPIDRLVSHFEDLIDGDVEVEVLRGIIDGIKFRTEPQYREILETLARDERHELATEAEKALGVQATAGIST